MVSLTLRYVFHVIFISLVAYLAVSVVFIRYGLRLWDLVDSKVVICFDMSLFVFSCFSLTSPLNPDKVVYSELLFGPRYAKTVAVWHISLKAMVVIRLLELFLRKVHWVSELALNQTSDRGRF